MVLNAFGYRWTTENHDRARYWLGLRAPTMDSISDTQWLADHAFNFIKDGSRLSFRSKYAEPVYMAD